MNANVALVIDSATAEQLNRLPSIIQDISEIKKILQKKQEENNLLGDWITEQKATEICKKKKTTLYKLRMAGELTYSDTRPVFYSLSSIKNYLEKNKK